MDKQIFPLTMTALGESVKVERILGGDGMNKRLATLGLTPGTQLCIVQDGGGPLVISVRDSRIALGRGLAHKIMVSQNI
jgi:Fe2+ transport system protein FeoA